MNKKKSKNEAKKRRKRSYDFIIKQIICMRYEYMCITRLHTHTHIYTYIGSKWTRVCVRAELS